MQQEKWDQLLAKAEDTTDQLGKKLDPKIKDVVVSLWSAGFETTGSCEGHLDWGLKGPWVDIGKNPTDEDLSVLEGISPSL